MLDIQFIRKNPELIKTACTNKNLDPKVIDDLLIIDQFNNQWILYFF